MNAPGQSPQKKMTGNEIRRSFVEFFARNGHRVVPSSSLVPAGDPTLLFTNAGMNQFKDVFLGLEQRDYRRAVTVQKCVRAGGKHNDLENVGRTARHQTFFEMLGNFSFGDYFKKEAIALAWDLVTKEWALPTGKLYFTVFGGAELGPGTQLGPDEESKGFWADQGAPTDRIFAITGLKDNFWAMGDTGPCGPCSEIFYDFGPAATDAGHKDCKFPCECGRYVEIWNLVFMQFNRDADGELKALPKPSVDTGAGLERLSAVLQGKVSNYDTDLLRPLIDFACEFSGKAYGEDADTDVSLRILADHSRAGAFLVADGVLPSNEGRGYVLRKILRRAIDHGRKLGLHQPFLVEMASSVADITREAYPEVAESQNRVATVMKHEEDRYHRMFEPAIVGQQKFTRALPESLARTLDPANPVDLSANSTATWLFHGYDTFGLPLDVLYDLAPTLGVRLHPSGSQGFDRLMNDQRERGKASWKAITKETARPVYTKLAETFRTEPDFYFSATTRDCRVEAIVTQDGLVNELPPGTEAEVVLDRTVFYAEAGGQVADIGTFKDNALSLTLAEVRGAYYPVAGLIAHRITAKETLRLGDRVALVADADRREHTKRNHTGTHLLHAALRNILGTHVKQAGSLVAPDHLRFDFSHFAAVDADELNEIEQQVNEQIRHNADVHTDVTTIDDALASGALAFFGDKYPEQNVRVVTIPDPAASRGFYSRELCGGTHVRRSGDIGILKIVAEQSVAAGVRRVEAITGARALTDYQQAMETLDGVARLLNVGNAQILLKIQQLAEQTARLSKEAQKGVITALTANADQMLEKTKMIKGIRVLSAEVKDANSLGLRVLVDTLRQKLGSGVVVLGTTEDGKVALISGVTKDLVGKVHAGKLVQQLAQKVGGSGGGRPDLAEAGGKDTSALKSALDGVYALVEQML